MPQMKLVSFQLFYHPKTFGNFTSYTQERKFQIQFQFGRAQSPARVTLSLCIGRAARYPTPMPTCATTPTCVVLLIISLATTTGEGSSSVVLLQCIALAAPSPLLLLLSQTEEHRSCCCAEAQSRLPPCRAEPPDW
jgi:hypothetical protein